jgi:hypothetical protein
MLFTNPVNNFDDSGSDASETSFQISTYDFDLKVDFPEFTSYSDTNV